MSTPRPVDIKIAYDFYRDQKATIEGPTRRQAIGMAADRNQFIADARKLLSGTPNSGDDEIAFELDCLAFDLECNLRLYGFDIETGKPIRKC